MVRFVRRTRAVFSCPLPAAGLVALACALPAVTRAGAWEDGASLPSPVANNAVATHARSGTTFVYTFMGIDSTKVWSGIRTWARRLNTVTNQWEDLPDVPAAEGKIAACAVALGDSVYVIGGYKVESNGSETTARRMMIWNAVTDQWVDDAALVPSRVDDMVAATWNGTHVVLVSGWSSFHNVPDVQFWERATNTWAAATPVPGFGTFGGAGGICGDHIVFVDGVADTAAFGFDLVNRVLVGTIDPLDPTNVLWEDRGPHPGAPVYRAASWNIPGDDDRIVFAGGSDNPYNFDGLGYDGNPSEPLGQVWSYHVPTGTVVFHADKPVPTMDHRGFPWGDGRLWIVGGMEAGQTVTARVSSWVPDAVTGAPAVDGTSILPEIVAWPNPARHTVRFGARGGEPLDAVRIVDVRGREVRRLEGGPEIAWDLRTAQGRPAAAGVYFLVTRVGGRDVARALTVLDR